MMTRSLFINGMICFFLSLLHLHVALAELIGEDSRRQEILEDKKFFEPIVAIPTQPADRDDHGPTYIAASYVKWLEQAGARSVYLRLGESWDEHLKVLKQSNAILLPGGADFKPHDEYYILIEKLYNYAKNQGLPLWGTCLGFEQMIAMSMENGTQFKKPVKASSVMLPMKLQDPHTWIWNELDEKTKKTLTEASSQVHMHEWGYLWEDYENSEEFQMEWRVLGTANTPDTNIPFLSFVVNRQHPNIAGTQFHPEKNAFEHNEPYDDFDNGSVSHHKNNLLAMFHLGSAFVERIRAATDKILMDKDTFDSHSFIGLRTEPQGSFTEVYIFQRPTTSDDDDNKKQQDNDHLRVFESIYA